MILHRPRLDREKQLLRYSMVSKDWFRPDTALCDAIQLPGIRVTNRVVSMCAFIMNCYGNYSSPCIINFTCSSLKLSSNWFQFYRYISVLPFYFNHDELYVIRRLVCIDFKSYLSIHTMSWSSIFFLVEVYHFFFFFAFHDQPEEDSGC